MNNKQIEEILRGIKSTTKHFLGVFPSDILPKKKINGFLIVNFCRSNTPGKKD